MAFNCRLNRNIEVGAREGEQETNSCYNLSLASGGIRPFVHIFNIDDVQNLIFSEDNRYDDELFIETIVTSQPYYTIYGTSLTYNETQNKDVHTHELTIQIGNIDYTLEDIINDATNGKFLVCFLPNGDTYYRVFGWNKGATLSYTLNVSEDVSQYSITLNDESEFALMACDPSNFNIKNKVYDPIFKPLYEIPQCQKNSKEENNGFLLASYVVKVNSAGQALDSDNKLCEYSHKKQDAYKLSGLSDGNYHILGSYGETAEFDGKPIKIYDTKLCPKASEGSIFFLNDIKNIVLGENWDEGNIPTSSVTLYSENPWELYSTPSNVNVTPISGLSGNTTVIFKAQGSTTNETVLFKNVVTEEVIGIDCKVYYPLPTARLVSMNDKTNNASVVVNEENAISYSAKTSSYLSSSRSGDEFTISVTNRPSSTLAIDDYLTVYATAYPSMKLYIDVNLQGYSNAANWYVLESYCMVGSDGKKNGIRYNKYTDINPQSPTYGIVSSTTSTDASCAAGSPTWVTISQYCETDGNGANTGYRIRVLQDINLSSPTYGDTSEDRVADSSCGKQSTEPHWVQNPDYQNYCVQTEYNGWEGNSGMLHVYEIDDNEFSATAGEERERDIEDLEHCPLPSLEPTWAVVTEVCQVEDNKKGALVYNGYADTTYQNTNKYSPTYLSFSSATVTSESCTMEEPQPPQPDNYEFDIRTTKLEEFLGEAHTFTIEEKNIISTKNGEFIDYELVSKPNWCTVIINSDKTITVVFEENSGEDRSSTIEFKQNESNLTDSVEVIQHGAEVCYGYGVFNGDSWFDLGWKSNMDMEYEIELISNNSLSYHIFGGRQTASAQACGMFMGVNAGYRFSYGGSSISNNFVLNAPSQVSVGDDVNVHWGKSVWSAKNNTKGTEYTGNTTYITSPTITYNNYLGAINTDGTATTPFNGKIKFFRVWDNGTLIHEYVFKKDGSETVLYDIVTKTTLHNQGSGTVGYDDSPCGGGGEDPISPVDTNNYAYFVGVTNIERHGLSLQDYSNFGRFEVATDLTTLPSGFVSIQGQDMRVFIKGLTKKSYNLTINCVGLSQSNSNLGFFELEYYMNPSEWTINGSMFDKDLRMARGAYILTYIPDDIQITVSFQNASTYALLDDEGQIAEV